MDLSLYLLLMLAPGMCWALPVAVRTVGAVLIELIRAVRDITIEAMRIRLQRRVQARSPRPPGGAGSPPTR